MSRKIRHGNIVAVFCIAAAFPAAAVRAAAPPADAAARRQREKRLIETLKGPAPWVQKDQACRELRVIGTTACIPALAALLPDEKLSHMARYALEPMPYPEAGRALREALAKTSGPAKVGVINSLGFRRDKQAAAALIKLLKDRDADVAAAAAAALGRVATPEAARALDEFRAGAAKPLQAVAAEASLTAAGGLLRQGRSADAARIYEDLQGRKWPAHVRLGAFVGLLAARPGEAPARVVEALADKDTALRAVAIAQIAALKGPGVAGRFAAELPKLPADVQVLLIGALADRGDAAVRPALIAAASGPSPKVRTAAVKALGRVGDATCVEVLCKAVAAGRSDEEKQAAAKSLRRLRGEGVNAALVKCMKAAPLGARPELIGALVARKATGAVGDLLEQARGRDKGVRTAALRALAWLAEPKELPALLQLLVELEGDAARTEAERAVVQVSRKIADESARADAVLAALRKTTAAPARCSLLRALGGIASAEALQAVRAALTDKQPAVRDAAVRALADWPDPRATDALLAMFRTTGNETHRVLALRGCVRLLGLGGRPMQDTLKAYGELIKAARRAQDKRLVLAGLAGVADPGALKLVEPFLADTEVRAEAELAMLGIARGIMGSAREEARAAARKLLAESKNKNTRQQAARIIGQIEKFEDYIVAWQVSGPYTQPGKGGAALFDVALPPEKPGAKGVAWRPLPAGGKAGRPWMLDLLGAVGGEQRACYVRTWVHSDKQQPARLEFGTDDGNKVWLNGRLVHSVNRGGAAVPGDFRARVTLREGWNALMLKITQDTGPWEFCLRIRNPAGGKLGGLRVRPRPPTE